MAHLEPVQRTHHPTRPPIQHMRVDHRRAHIIVPQQLLDGPDITPTLQQMRREAVPGCGFWSLVAGGTVSS